MVEQLGLGEVDYRNNPCDEGGPFPYPWSSGKPGGRLSVNGVNKSS